MTKALVASVILNWLSRRPVCSLTCKPHMVRKKLSWTVSRILVFNRFTVGLWANVSYPSEVQALGILCMGWSIIPTVDLMDTDNVPYEQ